MYLQNFSKFLKYLNGCVSKSIRVLHISKFQDMCTTFASCEILLLNYRLKAIDLPCKFDTARKINLQFHEGLQSRNLSLLKNGYLKIDREYYPSAEYCINGYIKSI